MRRCGRQRKSASCLPTRTFIAVGGSSAARTSASKRSSASERVRAGCASSASKVRTVAAPARRMSDPARRELSPPHQSQDLRLLDRVFELTQRQDLRQIHQRPGRGREGEALAPSDVSRIKACRPMQPDPRPRAITPPGYGDVDRAGLRFWKPHTPRPSGDSWPPPRHRPARPPNSIASGAGTGCPTR